MNTSSRNHQVFQNGGKMVISSVAALSFQMPSLLAALTRKMYLPGSRLV
jgi:hypothetical protein